MRPWESEIDDSIIDKIGKEGKKIASGELKRSIERHLKREISTDVYSRHIQELTSNTSSRQSVSYAIRPVLRKEDTLGRGKEVFYSFSPEAGMRYRLRLPITKLESKKEIAYQLLFMYIKNPDVSRLHEEDIKKYTFNTEEQFNSFLSKINVQRRDFQIQEKVDWQKTDSDGNIIYRHTNLIEPNKHIQIGKTEYPQENKCSYICVLPGISVKDFKHFSNEENNKIKLPLEHTQLSNSDIEEIFNLLEQEKLITKIKSQVLEFLGEDTRYDVTNNRLRKFIKDCWELYGAIELRMIFEWKYFRYAKEKTEKHWYRRIRGTDEADSCFASYQKTLVRLKTSGEKLHDAAKKEAEKHIRNYDKLIPEKFKEICDAYDGIIAKYPIPARMLLDLVYPQFLRDLHKPKNKAVS